MAPRAQQAALSFVKYSDLALAAVVILIVGMMIIPLPAGLLDLLLTFNLTFALVVMLTTIYTLEPLQFSIFPSLLLLTTLMRLALNVSSTRLILLNGYAGEVINRFGQFVVGGNAVVGFVIFIILIVIQFVVITRGAERVAEVAARFTLDAMPGKQMSIDADLNAGLITDQEARVRRREVERGADFYGAMDGASKFVKGDAIAGIIITIINVMGGFIIGVAQRGMTVQAALQSYTLLTVGDGLVTQIPALLISVATGIVVTRAASEANLGQDVVGQIFSQPRVLYIAAATLVLLGAIPGLPPLPFFILAGVFALVGRGLGRATKQEKKEESQGPPETTSTDSPQSVVNLLRVDPVEVELGYGLLSLAERGGSDDLMGRISLLRRQLALELGMILPLVRLRDNMALEPNAYSIKLRGVEVSRGELMADRLLAMDSGTADGGLAGLKTREPAFGLPALWITRDRRDEAEVLGYTVVDPASVLITHLSETLKRHSHELLSRQEVKMLIDSVRDVSPAVVDELVPNVMTLGEVQKVLQNLLRERVPIRDLSTILETLADYGPIIKDPDRLSELVRQGLYRTISSSLPVQSGVLDAILLDPQLEETLHDALQQTEGGSYLALNPDVQETIIEATVEQVRAQQAAGRESVVLASPLIRLYFKRLTERVIPDLIVVSHQEIEPSLFLEVVGRVGIQ